MRFELALLIALSSVLIARAASIQVILSFLFYSGLKAHARSCRDLGLNPKVTLANSSARDRVCPFFEGRVMSLSSDIRRTDTVNSREELASNEPNSLRHRAYTLIHSSCFMLSDIHEHLVVTLRSNVQVDEARDEAEPSADNLQWGLAAFARSRSVRPGRPVYALYTRLRKIPI